MNFFPVFYIVLLLLQLVFLVTRLKRMQLFHQVWMENPTEIEGRSARTNFFIHLFLCLILFFIAVGSTLAIIFYLSAGQMTVQR